MMDGRFYCAHVFIDTVVRNSLATPFVFQQRLKSAGVLHTRLPVVMLAHFEALRHPLSPRSRL